MQPATVTSASASEQLAEETLKKYLDASGCHNSEGAMVEHLVKLIALAGVYLAKQEGSNRTRARLNTVSEFLGTVMPPAAEDPMARRHVIDDELVAAHAPTAAATLRGSYRVVKGSPARTLGVQASVIEEGWPEEAVCECVSIQNAIRIADALNAPVGESRQPPASAARAAAVAT